MAFEESSWLHLDAVTDRRISREELRAFLEPIVAKTGGAFDFEETDDQLVTVAEVLGPQRKGDILVFRQDRGIHPFKRADLVALCNGHPETEVSFAISDTDERNEVITESECEDLERMIVRIAGQLAEHFGRSFIFHDQSGAVYSSDEMIQLAREGKQREESWAYKLARAQQLRKDQIIREGFAESGLSLTPPQPLRSPTRAERRIPKPPPIEVPPVAPEERARAVDRARQLVERIVEGGVIADPVAGSVLVEDAAVVVVPGVGLARSEWGLLTRCNHDHDLGHVVVFGERMIDRQVAELLEDSFIPARTQAELYDFLLSITSLHDRLVKPSDEMRSKVRELEAPPIERVRFWDGKAHQGIIIRLNERYAMLHVGGGEYHIFDIQRDLRDVLVPERGSFSVDRYEKVLAFEATGQGQS